MLWVYLLLVSIQQNGGVSPKVARVCERSGQPCVEFINNLRSFCKEPQDIRQSIEKREFGGEEEIDEYPWWIEKGSTRTLCCDVKVSEPMLIDTLQLQWYYYDKLESFGADNPTILQNDSDYITVLEKKPIQNRAVGRLTIKDAAYSSSGAYACRVVANTTAPDGYRSLEIGRISEPFAINVYSDHPEFSVEESEREEREVWLLDYETAPYTFIRCELQPVNPRKKLIIDVDADADKSFFQYIYIQSRSSILITPYGNLEESPISYQKKFTVNFFYENEEENKVSRTWTVGGNAYTPLAANKVIPATDDDNEAVVGLGKVFPIVVLGSCETFLYKVSIDDGDKTELVFDGTFSDTFKSIEDGNATLKYKFTDKTSYGDLAKTNTYVELALSRKDDRIDIHNKNTILTIFVSCDNEGSEEIQLTSMDFNGLPYFPTDETISRNCLSYNQTSPSGYYGPDSIRRRLCCETQQRLYNNVYLWHNGNPKVPVDYAISPLYDENLDKLYPWFEDYAGYYQCIVGKYQYDVGSGAEHPFYTMIKTRTYKIGFNIGDAFEESLDIDLLQSTSFLDTTDVSKYNVKLGKSEILVVADSCVGLLVQGVTFPQHPIVWKSSELDLFDDTLCKEIHSPPSNAEAQNPSITYTYTPYDKVKMEWRVYAGRTVSPSAAYSVSVKMSESETSVKITAKTPYLESPDIAQHPYRNIVTCTVTGYPLDRVTLYSINNKDEKVLQKFELTTASDDVLYTVSLKDGYRVTLEQDLGLAPGIRKVGCKALNSLLHVPDKEKRSVFDLKVASSPNVIVIVVAAIGTVLLVLIVWIVCACVAMARHPQTKFGEAMCCRTGPYKKVKITKLPMDKYKLEYSTLNPSTSLGEGHFGIIRRGFCNALPDRQGERIEIAIKEVKACVGRSRREDDLRRERDIMMRLRSHRNVVRIYGYTDEPDQLALVLEFAQFGSLDKLLMEARTIKSDGYLMPNEQINNPIQAFESKHIVDFGRQIADGMDYIGRNQIVHRDLAARNVVVAGDASEYILKITDFGLAREICDDGFYERVQGKEIPIKWTAPESLKNNISTDRSDVWSYGIVLWELCTLGAEPYAGHSNAEVMEKLRSGYRLQKPPSCNTDLYNLMRDCWLETPDDRPEFNYILTQLTEYSQNPSDYCSIEDLYETDLNLTLRLQTLQQPNNHVRAAPSPDTRPSPVRELRSRDSCDGSRDQLHPAPPDNGTMASNPYTADPCPPLPNNELV